MVVLAIDPGTNQSGWLVFSRCPGVSDLIIESGVNPNGYVKDSVIRNKEYDLLAIEGMEPRRIRPNAKFTATIGSETFDTCIWIGRFIENSQAPFRIIKRGEVLRHVAKHNAKDSEVRAALIKRFGAPGTRKEPGFTYGVSSHAWSALGVAITALETEEKC